MDEKLSCTIPVTVPVSSYLLQARKRDFFTWANLKWLKETEIPKSESEYGVSEEVERCVYKNASKLLKKIWMNKNLNTPEDIFLRTLANSCLITKNQEKSVEYLKEKLTELNCIKTKEDVFTHYSILSSMRFQSLLSIGYTINWENKIFLTIDPNLPSLPTPWYNRKEKMESYRECLERLGKELGVENLETCIATEKTMNANIEYYYSEDLNKTTGNELIRKFPGIPWNIFFEINGVKEWKKQILYYRSPRWIRFIGKMLKEIPLEMWKLLLARAYIFSSIEYLPAPFDEIHNDFFREGQKKKTPQIELYVNIVYDYCNDIFSPIFWKEFGDTSLVGEIQTFANSLIEATKDRLSTVEWLQPRTRKAAIEKINAMRLELVRPKEWYPYEIPSIDNQCILKNIFILASELNKRIVKQVGKEYRYWEEGIYRVNAYYFNETNEIMIPYGTIISPFYSKSESSVAWNYGALGSIIAHEICHAFDEDGKEYNQYGEKKRWWQKSDNREYKKKTTALIELYNDSKVLGEKVNGKMTLSENIADLAGLGIALHAFKAYLLSKNITDENIKKEEYKKFFIAYAVSWRTKYKDEKLKVRLETDKHAPAFLRVNNIVSQFDEWYEAFDIEKKTEDLIRIF